MTVDFNCTEAGATVCLDFTADQICKFIVNEALQVPKWERSKLFIGEVKKGANQVEITFHNNYAHDGLGLHHFEDVADGEEYVYTKFEAPFAHRAFPCFDQPNLKAKMSLTIVTLSYRRVIANEPGTSSPLFPQF